jgi:hypothetical protein
VTDETADPSIQLAQQAYVYGFPLVFNLDQVARYVDTGIGANPAAPFNAFSHARALATPADEFVTINNDTVYSMAQLDLSVGPVLLTVPDVGDRYYVLQFVSAWTENFAYVGKRATGTAAGRFLLVPPGWSGDAPDDATVIAFPTITASIVGRWAVDGDDDLPAVHTLQDATTLSPLDPSARSEGVPRPAASGDEALDFWERYRVWSQRNPPPARDLAIQDAFAELGLTGDKPITTHHRSAAALREGHQRGGAALAQVLKGGHAPEVNGWLINLHAFDYNLDHFGIGTIDAPGWRIEEPMERLVMRAGAALGGLWGNHGYEAAYVSVYVDDAGEQLTGAHRYELTLDPPPPNDAFWSLTMYDVPNYFLVDNPIRRYSIGDRTPGIVTGSTGGVTITISHDEPADATARANWLPAPVGEFRPLLRVYVPGGDVLDGTYEVQPIRRIG